MKQIKETEKLILFEDVVGGSTSIYRKHKIEDSDPIKIYEFKKGNYIYVFEGACIKNLIFKGFSELPKLINKFGYGFNDKSLNTFFKYKFINSGFDTIIISDKIINKKKENELVLYIVDIENLQKRINQEQKACNDTKAILIKNFLIDKYPKLNFDYKETNNNKDLILRNLNSKLIEKLTADDVNKIGDFYINATKKFSRSDIVKKMFTGLQKNAQLISLQQIIKIYEKLLVENPSESSWQEFFNNYITLFDNRYAYKIDYKNIATGITKYPDLVLVDIYGYIDFFELKKVGCNYFNMTQVIKPFTGPKNSL